MSPPEISSEEHKKDTMLDTDKKDSIQEKDEEERKAVARSLASSLMPPPKTLSVSPSVDELGKSDDLQDRNDHNMKEEDGESVEIKRIPGPQMSFHSGIYSIPPWSAAPVFPFTLDVIKDGAIMDTLNVSLKGAYMFGRSDQCDFLLEHPSISRFHAVLQFKRSGDVFLYDLGSTHGTIINKKQVQSKTYVPLHVGDVFKFGLSSRLYVLQGPSELMPKEGPTKAQRQTLKESQCALELADQEASLVRAKQEAIQMEGATWGMMEDAYESEMQEEEEVTWQTYKGQLTEKQQKTLEKIQKRNEKVASLKREIDAIQVKEIPQGGLTQGQQTQVARNQQRIEQLMEELESLEETLNQSIQESIGARARRGSSKKGLEEEDESSSDDDFYDRTSLSKKGKANAKSATEPAQVVETAESLLEKRATIIQEIERLKDLLESEESSSAEVLQESDTQDPLDAFMSTVSTNLDSERASSLKKEMEKQQADLDRTMFLLKVADPTGEALKRWGNESLVTCPQAAVTCVKPLISRSSVEENVPEVKQERRKEISALSISKEAYVSTEDELEDKKKLESLKGPLWLGHARKDTVEKVTSDKMQESSNDDDNEFVEYKERHRSAPKNEGHTIVDDIPEDACGLILRKKPKEPPSATQRQDVEDESELLEGAACAVADTVALLLRHQRGLGATAEEFQEEGSYRESEEVSKRSTKKRKLGPEKPQFLNKEEGKFQAWVPPAGQTGDGRTALNEKYGY